MTFSGNAFRTWDDYFVPGTSVLRNLFTVPGMPFGETDPVKLEALEAAVTSMRLAELDQNPIPGRFDYEHMQAIHRHLFQDVYAWAGVPRLVPEGGMTKLGPNVLDPTSTEQIAYRYYPGGAVMNEAAEQQFALLAGRNYLRGLDQGSFVQQLGEHWGELNLVHPFREGNTRSQFAFFSQLTTRAGYRLDNERFRPVSAFDAARLAAVGTPNLRDQFILARFYSQATGRNDRLAGVLGQAIQKQVLA